MLIRRSVIPAALFLALAAGCANNNTTTDAGAPAPAASAAGTPESVTPSTAAPSAPAGSTTLTGTVTAGVEPGCLLLKDGSGDHLLIFKDEAQKKSVTAGSKITVVGKANAGLMTTCQQGKPFEVSSVAGS